MFNLPHLFSFAQGLVLHRIDIADGERYRHVGHRFSISEMVVPYGSPHGRDAFKCAFDAGEDGLGNGVNSLKLGCDCLGQIHYW
jgi:primary-amine oxidase